MSIRIMALLATAGAGFLASCSLLFPLGGFEGEARDASDADAGGDGFAARCTDGFADCDDDPATCETEILGGDNNNCGACGRSCQACGTGCEDAGCTKGVCSVVLVASGQSSPSGLMTDDAGVYWVNRVNPGAVMFAPRDTLAPRALATGLDVPINVAVDDAYVYWTEQHSGVIGRTTLACGPSCAQRIVSLGVNAVYWVTLDDAFLYWTGGLNSVNEGKVRGLAKNADGGGGGTTLALLETNPGAIVTDGTFLYWKVAAGYDEPSNPGVLRRPKTFKCPFPQDCVESRVLGNLADVMALAVDATSLYVAGRTADAGIVLRAPKVPDAGAIQPLALGPYAPTAIARDDRYVYWTTPGSGSGNGAVLRVGLDGTCPSGLPCPMSLVAGGGPATTGPQSVAVDATTVYFSTSNGGVWKVAK